jgi:hypothetical protein
MNPMNKRVLVARQAKSKFLALIIGTTIGILILTSTGLLGFGYAFFAGTIVLAIGALVIFRNAKRDLHSHRA